jgi:NADP-reducing hydrogenase subunit HndD
MEEGTELLGRISNLLEGKSDVKNPLMTSCCPGWVNFVEQNYPELIDNLSTAKSPQQMMGAVIKNYFAAKLNIPRKNVVVVSLMPCLAKKFECLRPEMGSEGDPDVNYVLYTRELARLIRFANVNFEELPESNFDSPLGESTGAGTIFGTTGGVMEAVVRTAYSIYTGKPAPKIDFEELRGFEGIKQATIDFNGVQIKLGIAHGLGNARKLADSIVDGSSDFHAIEVMACPGGCIGGGGQPFHHGDMSVLKKRATALYEVDRQKTLRKSHENPAVRKLYADFLGTPCGPLSHKLLHTHYLDRKKIVGIYPHNQETAKEIGSICLSPQTIEELKTICSKFNNDAGELINILHAVQEHVGYLPKEVQEVVAEQVRIPLSKVYGVVTFYSFFTMAPKGKYPISVCLGTACYVRGAEKVLDEFRNLLKIKLGETTPDGLFSLDCLRCVGACGFSPVVLVGKKVYVRMTPEKVRDVLNDYYCL